MQSKNIIFVVGLLLAGGLLFFVITSAIDDSVYMMPVNKAVEEQAKHEGREIKVRGNVVPGTIVIRADNRTRFRLTKGGETIVVYYEGTRPDTFKDCADVIVTGELSADQSFEATEMLAKCPSKYDELPGGCETAPEGVVAGAEGSSDDDSSYSSGY